jgi:hypothetical protein
MTGRTCTCVAVVPIIMSAPIDKRKVSQNREIAVLADAVGGTMGEGSAKPC